MFYKTELDFVMSALKNMRLQTYIFPKQINSDEFRSYCTDHLLYNELFFNESLLMNIQAAKQNTVYRFSDTFGCSLIFMLLPNLTQDTIFAVGPFLTHELTRHEVLEKSEMLSLSPKTAQLLENYYGLVPQVFDGSTVLVLIETFAQHIFGSDGNFSLIELSGDLTDADADIKSDDSSAEEFDLIKMEKRYDRENELIYAVRHGLSSRAEMLFSNFTELSFEKRLSDPLRNLKNYCIIMNTLLRKAAESGGVHPLYIDKVSSDFAKRIEIIPNVNDVAVLMREMSKSYCRLVRKHSLKDYSPPVRKAIMYIDTDLSRDLSLSAISAHLNLSSAYLSNTFRHEVDKTITDFVNERRISQAKRLLNTTSLQIQTIAQHCGYLDVHYFSRVFKKITGKTPKEYRKGEK